MRYCALYECKICEFKACYYCLIDYSKRTLLQNITGVVEEEVKVSSRQDRKTSKKPEKEKDNFINISSN
jgi:hypothetical protein